MVYFLAFLSLFVTFLGHLPRKKKKRIQCFAFLYLLPLRAPRMLDKHPLIAGQAADRLTWPFGPCGANAPVPSPGITGR